MCFYDAFAPTQQPELWEVGIFESLLRSMKPGAVLATYCAKGQVRRNMERAGWQVERHPGPPGKREMLVACNVPVSRWNVRCYALILNPSTYPHSRWRANGSPMGRLGANSPAAAWSRTRRSWIPCGGSVLKSWVQQTGLTWLGHAYTNDFFVRSAFREDEQILAVYHWMQADHEGICVVG